jgi:glutamate transport system substrate-binding protein
MASVSLSKLKSTATVIAVVSMLIIVGAAACQDKTKTPDRPSVEEKLAQAGLADHDKHPKLRIGVYTNRPLLGFVDNNGTNQGFEVDVARYVAKNLGYDSDQKIEWVEIKTVNDRLTFLQQGKVDLLFASFSHTDKRCGKEWDGGDVLCAGPYLITEQSVIIPAAMDGKLSTIQDLENLRKKLCVATGSTSEKLLREDRHMDVSSLDSTELCIKGILNGTYLAASSDRTILVGFASMYPEQLHVLGLKLGTADNPGIEHLAVGVPPSNPALRELVDYFLNKSFLEQQAGNKTAWRSAFDKHLGRWYGDQLTQPPPKRVPDLLDYDAKAPTP